MTDGGQPTDARLTAWIAALEQRHLANLTRSELTRALRALSSCYVERREKLPSGAPLESAGKRAAFALFYGPLHFLTVAEVVRGLDLHEAPIATIHDLGCGTGVAGAAWAFAGARPPVIAAVDRSSWAVAEANWTYAALDLQGRARTGDLIRQCPGGRTGDAIVLAYAVNELTDAARSTLLPKLVDAVRGGKRAARRRTDRPARPGLVAGVGGAADR